MASWTFPDSPGFKSIDYGFFLWHDVVVKKNIGIRAVHMYELPFLIPGKEMEGIKGI